MALNACALPNTHYDVGEKVQLVCLSTFMCEGTCHTWLGVACSFLNLSQRGEEGNHLQIQLDGELWLGERALVKKLL